MPIDAKRLQELDKYKRGSAQTSGFDLSQVQKYRREPIEDSQNIPLANTSSESFLDKLPRNIAAGLLEMGRNLGNTPNEYLRQAERGIKSLLPNDARQALQGVNFADTVIPRIGENFNYPEALGQKGKGTLMDNLIQGGIKWAPEIYGAAHLLHQIPAVRGFMATDLRKAKKLVGDTKIPLDEGLLKRAIPNLPEDHNITAEAINKARQGDYESIFNIQSKVGQHQRNLEKSLLASEKKQAPSVKELKRLILDDMEAKLKGHPNPELAKAGDLLRKGVNNYAQYKKIANLIAPYLKYAGAGSLLGAGGGLAWGLMGLLLKGKSNKHEG